MSEGAVSSVLMSSRSVEWATPTWLFRELDREFGFTLDVCATPDNAKCARYFTAENDGLAQEWTGTVWMNPPYGRGIGRWMAKAAESAAQGATVVCLVPARVDTEWWHATAWDTARQQPRPGVEVRFLRGRVTFGGSHNNAAPFPSAVVIFRPSVQP